MCLSNLIHFICVDITAISFRWNLIVKLVCTFECMTKTIRKCEFPLTVNLTDLRFCSYTEKQKPGFSHILRSEDKSCEV